MKQIKNNLTEIEKRTQKYFDIAKVILVAIDAEGNVKLINKEGCKVLGYSKKEIIGKNWFDNFLPERTRNEAKSAARKILSGDVETFASYENPVLTKNGLEKLITWNNTYIKDKSGKIIATLSSGKDITRRRQLEDRSRYLYNVLTAVRNVNQLITREKNTKKLIEKTCKILIETPGYKSAWIILIDEEGKIIHTAEEGMGKDFILMVERIKSGKPTYCWKKAISSSAIIIRKDNKNCLGCPLYGKYENSSAATKRLACGGKIYGMITACVPIEYAEDKEEKRLFSEIARDLSFALCNLEKEKILKENEKKYYTIFENTGTATAMLEEDKTISMINSVFKKLSGYSRGDVENKKRWTEFVAKEDLERMKKYHLLRRTKLGKAPRNYEFRFVAKSGDIKNIFITVSMIPGTKKSIASLLDITDRKKAEDKLRASHQKLQKTLRDVIDTLASVVEIRDPYTAGHQERVTSLSIAIAEELGLDKDKIKAIGTAALIHDIGKINIPASILARPGKISDIEYDMIKTHSQVGYDMIKKIDFPWPIADIVLQHHERLNGSGYPKGLKGKDIMLEAKILAVADVVEAMSSYRPYRPALGMDKALEEIKEGKGKLYDSKVADVCIKLITKKKFKF